MGAGSVSGTVHHHIRAEHIRHRPSPGCPTMPTVPLVSACREYRCLVTIPGYSFGSCYPRHGRESFLPPLKTRFSMSNDPGRTYPPGVPERRRRPDASAGSGMAALGAMLGLAVSENIAGALVGGLAGYALTPTSPAPLKDALQRAFAEKGATLINLYRRGPYHATVLFAYGDGNWTVQSRAPKADGWTRESLNDWLFGDLVDEKLPAKLRAIEQGQRHST